MMNQHCGRCGGQMFLETVADGVYRKYRILQCLQCGYEEEMGRDIEAAKGLRSGGREPKHGKVKL